MAPVISAAICTYNREQFIEKAVRSLVSQSLGNKHFEILIIDNNSSDNTKQLIEPFVKSDPQRIKYFFEFSQGLSHARNRAIKEARGKLIAFLDDDAIASPDWLKLITEAFDKVKPKPAVVGGKVYLEWGGAKPEWTNAEIETVLFAGLDLGDTKRWFEQNEGPVGANVAYDREVLLRNSVFFNPDLGRIGNCLLSGEEGHVLNVLRSLGYNAFYVPSASVRHHVPRARTTLDYAIERFYWNGVSIAKRKFEKYENNSALFYLYFAYSRFRLASYYTINYLSNKKAIYRCKYHYWRGMVHELSKYV